MSEKLILDAVGTILKENSNKTNEYIDSAIKALSDEMASNEKLVSELKTIIYLSSEKAHDTAHDNLKSIKEITALVDAIEIPNTDVMQSDLTKHVDNVIDSKFKALPVPYSGSDGRDGVDGAGIETKQWDGGIYREGSIVISEIGQYFKALKDTNSKPKSGDDWERLGTAGFRWRGTKPDVKSLEVGDMYIDGGTSFLFDGTKGKMIAQRGKAGADGKDGKDGLKGLRGSTGNDGIGIVDMYQHGSNLTVVLDDGTTKHFKVDLEITEQHIYKAAEFAIERIQEDIAATGSIPLTKYSGFYDPKKSYTKGEMVRVGNANYLALENIKPNDFTGFEKFSTLSSGGGGGGGAGGWASTALSRLNMNGFNIAGLANPRLGTIGQLDAVNRYSMEQAIAAKSLYQGLYVINTNTPHLATLTDTGFVPPVAGQTVNDPNVGATPGVTTPATDILTWCNWGGNGFDTFTVTTTKPTPLTVKLSNGKMVTANIPAATYATEAVLVTALEAAFTASPEITHFHVYVNGTDCHIGVETTAPIYCIGVSDQTGNSFPLATVGAGNSVLNSYNWVIKTADENKPEALPPGLPGIPAGTVVKNSDSLIWSEVNHKFEISSGSSLTQAFADDRYWQVDGHNMAWSDRGYSKSTIVYSTAKNAWFVTTQNIPPGSPAPGTLAAGAMYRKINSTYGSTVMFGKGDFDPTDTTAANRWGMPAGTYPSGQQPLNGDTYFNVLSGSTTDFVVTEHPPEFVIRGIFDDRFGISSTTADDNILDTWPLHAPTIPRGSAVHVTAGHIFIGGQFQGTMVGGEFFIVNSGDRDADDGGWVIVPKANLVNHTAPWALGTPHPQTVPDTIVGNTVYGFVRNIKVQLMTNVAVGAHVVLVKKLPDVSFRLTCELLDENDGTIYEFFLTNIQGTHAPEITPVNILPAGAPGIEEIIVHYDATNLIYITAVINANGVGRTYKLEIDTQDFNLGVIEKGNGFESLPGKTSGFASMNKYPAQLIPMQLIGAKNLIGDKTGVLLTISHNVEVGHIYQVSSVVRAVYDNESDYFETQLGVDVAGAYTRHNSFYSISKGGRYESSVVGLDIYKATKSENLKFVLKLAAFSAGVILKDSSFSVIDMGV